MGTSLLRRALPLILASAILPYFIDLGGSSIWDANEAYYVETPREMMERGDYVFPMFNYEPRLNKPVLSYWMVIGLYKAFGISVGVQRLGIAVGGMILIAAAFVLGRLLSPTSARTAGLLAAAGLAVDPRLVMFARRIFIDIWISAFMALILMFFALAERYPERRRLFLVLMYVSVGLGMLTKGPIAAVLPGLVFFLYLLAHRELRRVTQMMIPLGVVIVLAIVAPWYYALYLRDGWTYIVSFFFGENVTRFTSGIGQITPRPWWFYGPVVLGDGLPMSLFLGAAAVQWFRTRPGDRVVTLLWLWIVVIVGFFSFSHDKQDLYIFPIVPAVAALGASAIVRNDHPRLLSATAGTLALLFALLGGAILYLFGGAGRIYAIQGVTIAAAALIAGGVVGFAMAILRGVQPAVAVLLATLVAFNWTFVLQVLPSFERYKPVPQLSDFLRDRLQSSDRIAHYNVAMPSMVYYLRHHVEPHYSADTFVEAMRSSDQVYGMLRDRDYDGMTDALAGRACVLHRVPTFDVKLRTILAREPLPEILLLSNRCAETGRQD